MQTLTSRLSALLLCLLAAVSSLAQSPRLLPAPQQFTQHEGSYHGSINAATINIVTDTQLGTFDYKVEGFANEGYRLSVTPEGISITAASELGVLRAKQTLRQLIEQPEALDFSQPEAVDAADVNISCCDITDYPAFKVRGYMHDVGRSYISFAELKKEIDLLSRFKVNMFHWHLTDNHGFRFESKTHPEVNTKGFKRFVGKYYTQDECRELDEYARQRGVIIIPEIDMPGHSESFIAATGQTMASEKGRAILKDILGELVACFPNAPYIHIGGDETPDATIAYINEMADFVHGKDKKVVIWNTYGPAQQKLADPKTMRVDMLTNWATTGRLVEGVPNIDMRYFYVNHFDVFADLAGAYRSLILDAERGNPSIGGVSIGIWNDKYIGNEQQIIAQNNLYATVIAMTERAWKGGEGHQYIEKGGAFLPNDGAEYEEYADWEDRFLYYRDLWLADEPIPYVRSANVRWNITPSYDNAGNSAAVFEPETTAELTPQPGSVYATGAGQWLNHIWNPTVKGVLGSQSMNQTRYAWTYVYSPEDQEVGAQIEFYNYSRSDGGLVPQNKKWDLMGSRVWINDEEILPTWNWTNAGTDPAKDKEIGNLNFPARQPVKVSLKKGWNKVLIKLPYVKAGQGRPNKWQYTFVFTTLDGKHAVDGLIYSPKKMTEGEDFTNPKYEPVYPTASTELEQHYYSLSTPQRDGYYVTSSGLSSIMTSLKTPTDASYWKFVERSGGTYDIINYKDGGYISPSASQNAPVKCVKSRPSKGWTLEPADTDGYFIIYCGTTQLNQTKSTQKFQLYNWGYKSVTGQDYNTSDTGCQFLIRENEDLTVILDAITPPLRPADGPSERYDLQGRRLPADRQQAPEQRRLLIENGTKRMR